MRRIILSIVLVCLLALPVSGMEFQAPRVPDSVDQMVPEEAASFPEGLWNVLSAVLKQFAPSLSEAGACCSQLGCIMLLCSLTSTIAPGLSKQAVDLCGVGAVSAALMQSTRSLLALGAQTVTELSAYGRLLLPVLASALAAQGGVSTSAALYVATAALDAALSSLLSGVMLPMLWVQLALGIGCAAIEIPMLSQLRRFVTGACAWILKAVLYIFTAYMTITGAVSGAADATAVRAAKLAISGAVPVVGGILSDASEAVLVSAGVMGSGAGIYGILTVLALFGAPFVRLGVQYLLLRIVTALGTSFDGGGCVRAAEAFSGVLGLMLGMVGTQTVLLLISTVCFMKGVA